MLRQPYRGSSPKGWAWMIITTSVLALTLLLREGVATSTPATILQCPTEQDVAFSNESLASPILTRTFGVTMVAYQGTTSNKIFVKIASLLNGSFTTEEQFEVATGELVSFSQSVTTGLVYYREGVTGDILAKQIDIDTGVVDVNPIQVMSHNDSSGGFGSFYTSKQGFVAWGTSVESSHYTVKKQSPTFPNPDAFNFVLSENATSGVILAAAIDPKETIVWILNRTDGLWLASYVSAVTDSFFVKNKIHLIGTVPILPNSTVRTIAANDVDTFMLLTSQTRNGNEFFQSLHTNSRGLAWTDSLEVGSISVDPSSSSPLVQATWAQRWVVVFATQTGFQYLQMTPSFPFEFDWRAAFRVNTTFDFISANSSVALLVTRDRLLTAIGQKRATETDHTKLTAFFCVPIVASSSMGIGASGWSLWLVGLVFLFVFQGLVV